MTRDNLTKNNVNLTLKILSKTLEYKGEDRKVFVGKISKVCSEISYLLAVIIALKFVITDHEFSPLYS